MEGLPVIIVKERGRPVAVEVAEEGYVIPQETGALLVALGCNPSERENPRGLSGTILDAYHEERQK